MVTKEEIKAELSALDDEIRTRRNACWTKPEYSLLDRKSSTLRSDIRKKEEEMRKIKREISDKYIKDYRDAYYHLTFAVQGIKSSVKMGIKRGLGVKYVSDISDDDLIGIVKKLIQDDLEKMDTKELTEGITKMEIEVSSLEEEKRNIMTKEIEPFIEKRKEVAKRLVEKMLGKESEKKETRKIVEKKLPELMDKIRKEVQKGLLLDGITR
jgi:hypothetical protein